MTKNGEQITFVKSMELEKKNVTEAAQGTQLAISLPNVTMGRQLNEGDVLYPFYPESEFIALKKFKKFLTPSEITVLKEVAEIMRQKQPTWGI